MTGFPPAVRELVAERSGGVCEIPALCRGDRGCHLHHRRPRGAGGSSLAWVNKAGNALNACLACHMHAEANRMEATANGWLVSLHARSACTPVLYRGERVLLGDGGLTPTIRLNRKPRLT